MEQAQRASGERQASGPRAEFWKLRGLRGAKKNVRRNRDDLLQLTIQGKFPAYEKVLLREGLCLVSLLLSEVTYPGSMVLFIKTLC